MKRQQGYRKDRINDEEPVPEGPIGSPPEWLDKIGRLAWERVAHELEVMGVGTSADREMLAVYCDAFTDWTNARLDIADNGLTIETPTTTKANPAYAIKGQAQKTMTQILAHFGFSPASRAALHVASKPAENPLAFFMEHDEPDGS